MTLIQPDQELLGMLVPDKIIYKNDYGILYDLHE